MKGIKVLGSSALLAYFEGEEGGAKVKEFLKEAAEKEKNLLISAVNWGEVLYVIEGRHGKEKKNEVEHLMNQMHLEVIDIDRDLTRQAAHLRANEKLAYADCFAAALALSRKAGLVTRDKDFRQVEDKISVTWI